MKRIESGSFIQAAEEFLRPTSDLSISRRRERSWDFCYSHFQASAHPSDHMELSCLHLGYYLASWGMLRGSSDLFGNSNARHYEGAIDVIEEFNPRLRGWDVPAYHDEGMYELYGTAWNKLKSALLPDGGRGLVLVSKVMLGVWGCVPSFDTYFLSTFKSLSDRRGEKSQWDRANEKALASLHEVWQEHQTEIRRVQESYPVLRISGGELDVRMPIAKVIDIYGFQTTYRERRTTSSTT